MSRTHPSCTVLVVDDDAAIREVLRAILEDEGYAVEEASNGQQALQRLRHGFRPRLILLDWKMPIMSGAQFRVEQKQDPTLASIPVAVLSAHITHSPTEQIDADVFLAKPLAYDRLVETIGRYCAV